MTHSLRQRRSARFAPRPAPIRSRPSDIPDNRGAATKPIREKRDGLTLELPMLEAEVMGLRQLLAEVKASRDELRQEMDELRRDRDRWQSLAERAGPPPPRAGRRAWFCGRASQGG